jgi:surface polysaccharide O-acyltransferase-like enzyme
MGEIGRAVDVTIRAVADYHAEASATPDLKEISGRKVEFDYLRVYVFITWLQYLLLGSGLAPIVKGIVVFLGTLILSWVLVAAFRRIPAVAKVI